MPDELRTRADYFRLMNVNGAAHVYREALRAGFLDALLAAPRTAADLAAVCETDERATVLVLEVLEAVGVVQREGAACALTPVTTMLLGTPYRNLGDDHWAHFPEFLRGGTPWVTMDAVAQSETFYKTQATSLAWMLGPAAHAAGEVLGVGTQHKDLAVLDVGAGSAIWSLSLAARDPGTTVTAVDWPAVLEVARATAERMQLADRLTTVPGNYHEVELRDGAYDLVVIGMVTHLESEDGNRALFARAHATLKEGGRVVIFDVFPGAEQGDLNRTLYALGLALRTESGVVHRPEALEGLLGEAGFAGPERLPLPVPPFAVGALVATKG